MEKTHRSSIGADAQWAQSDAPNEDWGLFFRNGGLEVPRHLSGTVYIQKNPYVRLLFGSLAMDVLSSLV